MNDKQKRFRRLSDEQVWAPLVRELLELAKERGPEARLRRETLRREIQEMARHERESWRAEVKRRQSFDRDRSRDADRE